MDNPIKINVSSVSHAGRGYSGNEDNFYMNGRYKYEYEMENIQVTTDCISKDHIFAVSDGLDRVATERRPSISMVKELKKFQDQLNMKSGDFESRIALLKDRLEETNNIIYSMSLGDSNSTLGEKQTSFASLFISEGRVVALNIGKTKIYLFRDGSLRPLTGDIKKSDKLLKMGIITNEQANLLTGKFGIPMEDSIISIQKSEILELKAGDLFMVCSDGLTGVLDEEKINEVLSIDKETSLVSNMLVKEALKNGAKDNITVVVLKVEIPNNSEKVKTNKEEFPISRSKIQGSGKKSKSYTSFVIAAVAIIIAGAIAWGVWIKLFTKDPGPPLVADNEIVSVSDTQNDNTNSTTRLGDSDSQNDGEPTDNPENVDSDVPQDNISEFGIIKYTVKSGDNLQKISKKFYNDIEKYKIIMQENHLTDPNQIKIGQILRIPQE